MNAVAVDAKVIFNGTFTNDEEIYTFVGQIKQNVVATWNFFE